MCEVAAYRGKVVAIPLSFQLLPAKNRTHALALEAKKYGYSPPRIIVNKGDKIWNAAIDKGVKIDELKKHYSISKDNQAAYPYK